MTAEQKIIKMGLLLPSAPKPGGVYQPVLIFDNQAYVSGHGPLLEDQTYITGRVGKDLDVDAAKEAARQTGLAILASLKLKFGSLNKVERLVKSFGMVNAEPDFSQHPQVINGYSELMREVFGSEKGVGSRSAVGMGSLPGNMAVEIEAVFEIVPD